MADRKGRTEMATDTVTDQTQTPATPEAPAADGAAPKRTKKRQEGGYLYIPTPKVLRDKLDAEAAEKKVSVRELVSQKLATEYKVELPKPVERKKYATPEERKAAVNQQRKTKNALVALMMEKYAGQMEALQKELEAKMAAEAAEAAAKGAETPATA